jgi:hypothetical protein
MPKRVYYPPAYYKYRESHTSISVCIPRSYKKTLDILRGKQSYAAFFKNLINKFDAEVTEGIKNVQDELREQGRKEVREQEDNFRIPCSVCGKPVEYSSGDDDWPEVKEILYKAFSEWGHVECLDKKEAEVEALKTKTETSAAKSSTGQQKQQQQK